MPAPPDDNPNSCRSVVPLQDASSSGGEQSEAGDNPPDQDPPSTVAIKSATVVKIQHFQSPASFARLQCNTDLNTPPSNWLSNSANSYGLQQALSHSTGFTSFRMAHMFPDCLGEIDVVSSAENIKKLLKLPYSAQSGISLMIHRIENTLLIDDFDINKYLLSQAEDDWQWLKSFICENILSELGDSERRLYLTNSNGEALQAGGSLQTKFLYHSLTDGKPDEATGAATATGGAATDAQHQQLRVIGTDGDQLEPHGPLLPEPSVHENVPDPQSDHTFNRNVVWTFEDIRMLIGTDMPIFGSANRPCISLRLRDMNQPINVLTGIDYWLDNLMCNVPEVVMCYHLDGLVQKYELIPTEDLPNLENSKFSPKVIRNVAQNILAFLKQNATKAGHTYWLFKGRNDDFVKLYDLTSLCMNADEQRQQKPADGKKKQSAGAAGSTANGSSSGSGAGKSKAAGGAEDNDDDDESFSSDNPFTVPVAMLLYKVARNMKNLSQQSMSAKQAGAIKALLENCIQLLPRERYPQIVSSSHYILADLYVPASINPNAPDFSWSAADEPSAPDEDCDAQSTFTDATSDVEDGNGQSNSSGSTAAETRSPEAANRSNSSDSNDSKCTQPTATKKIRDTLQEFHLQANWKHNSSPPPIGGLASERCEFGLQHVVAGLGCLQFLPQSAAKAMVEEQEEEAREEERRRIRAEEQNPMMANARHAIPLPYERLRPVQVQREEARLADTPGIAIPMGWTKEATEGGEATAASSPSATKKPLAKMSKKQRRKLQNEKAVAVAGADENTAAPAAAAAPRTLLLHGTSGVIQSWHVHLKLLHLEKACLTYATLAEQAYTANQFGHSLRHIQLAMQCQLVVTKFVSTVSSQKIGLLGRAGDCYFQLAKAAASSDAEVEAARQAYSAGGPMDRTVRAELATDLAEIREAHEMAALLPAPSGSVEQLMVQSCECYERALRDEERAPEAAASASALTAAAKREFIGRLGSVRNELGVKYMHWAQAEQMAHLQRQAAADGQSKDSAEPLYQVFVRKAYDNLARGIQAFEQIADNANLAILQCNMGRFMRFRAHVVAVGECQRDVVLKRKFYGSAFASYRRALGILETRRRNEELWDLVTWEMSTGTFTLAQHILDNTEAARRTEAEQKEVVELLLAALRSCDTETAGDRQRLYGQRAGQCYHRLAQVYAAAYRRGWTEGFGGGWCGGLAGVETGTDEVRLKKLMQLARMYFEKAVRQMERMEYAWHVVHVQMDRLHFQQYLADASNTNNTRIRHLQQSVEILRQVGDLLKATEWSADPEERADQVNEEFVDDILQCVQSALLQLIKLCMQHPAQKSAGGGGDQRLDLATYKNLYAVSLGRGKATDAKGASNKAAGGEQKANSTDVLCRLVDAMALSD